MGTIEKVLAIMLGLIALYIIVVNPSAVDQILRSIGAVGSQTFGTLQGRNVSGGGISVGAFQR